MDSLRVKNFSATGQQRQAQENRTDDGVHMLFHRVSEFSTMENNYSIADLNEPQPDSEHNGRKHPCGKIGTPLNERKMLLRKVWKLESTYTTTSRITRTKDSTKTIPVTPQQAIISQHKRAKSHNTKNNKTGHLEARLRGRKFIKRAVPFERDKEPRMH
ncbi:hypothetical protein KIN20_032899 [Parelaphostrongylus tenuis]|uniref:Uncharacterized protein n=1 Tax=Parelaphostrongylus tenuis TaxID=148309 RepID=A0AAD5WIF5_PARTN|nr:hypothetical protein KIN20_032899 [Parelaphostrongylus tenuis]